MSVKVNQKLLESNSCRTLDPTMTLYDYPVQRGSCIIVIISPLYFILSASEL